MRKADLTLQPNDIVYIEPSRRIFRETLAEVTPLLSLLSSIIALIILTQRL
jgi:polysaccharide export outer membrane protein